MIFQVKPNTVGSSTRSIRMSAWSPLAHLIWADPPGRRSIVAPLSPNQVPRPSAVVSAAQTLDAAGLATAGQSVNHPLAATLTPATGGPLQVMPTCRLPRQL